MLILLLACSSPDNSATEPNSVRLVADTKLYRGANPHHLFPVWYDWDGDGYGDPATAHPSHWVPRGYVTLGGDCDDTDATVYPGAGCAGPDTGGGTADTGGGGSDTAPPADDSGTPDTAPTGDTAAEAGITITMDASSGASFPATIWAWYGSGGSASQSVSSATESLEFFPSAADVADHPWVDVEGNWGSTWSDGCAGFAAASTEFVVTKYQNTSSGTATGAWRLPQLLALRRGRDGLDRLPLGALTTTRTLRGRRDRQSSPSAQRIEVR